MFTTKRLNIFLILITGVLLSPFTYARQKDNNYLPGHHAHLDTMRMQPVKISTKKQISTRLKRYISFWQKNSIDSYIYA